MLELGTGPVASRAAAAIAETRGALAMLGLWSRPETMVVGRRGNPLHESVTSEGVYLASLADGLPGRPSVVDDRSVLTLKRKGATITRTNRPIVDEDEEVAPLYQLHVGGGYRGG